MAITAGGRLGVYEITAPVGEGGPPSLALILGELRRGLAEAKAVR